MSIFDKTIREMKIKTILSILIATVVIGCSDEDPVNTPVNSSDTNTKRGVCLPLEVKLMDASGVVSLKKVYEYNGSKRTSTTYDENGQVTGRTTEEINEYGQMLKQTQYDADGVITARYETTYMCE